eukprot:TRINITY_DN3340_c0_g1_i1.p1 TRINITY_DN3340_c0_g1~~TRINITY_DN3340_c0_g1_i1.p1  ORF type:complete len:448 (+),score=167.59 TRINITY_DN3340_c0_g1_i1:114-1457(+)
MRIPALFEVKDWKERATRDCRGVGKQRVAPRDYAPQAGEERATLQASPPRPKRAGIADEFQKSSLVGGLEQTSQHMARLREEAWLASQEAARQSDTEGKLRRKEFYLQKQEKRDEAKARLRDLKRAAKELSSACWQRNEEQRIEAHAKMINDERRNQARRRQALEEFQQRMSEGNKAELEHSKDYRMRLMRKVKDHLLATETEKAGRQDYLQHCYDKQRHRLDARRVEVEDAFNQSLEMEEVKRSMLLNDRDGGQRAANGFSQLTSARGGLVVEEKRSRRVLEEKALRGLRNKHEEFAMDLRIMHGHYRKELAATEASEKKGRKRIMKEEKAAAAFLFGTIKAASDVLWMSARALDSSKAKQMRLYDEMACRIMMSEVGTRRAAQRREGRDRRNIQQVELKASKLSDGLALQKQAHALKEDSAAARSQFLARIADRRQAGASPKAPR